LSSEFSEPFSIFLIFWRLFCIFEVFLGLIFPLLPKVDSGISPRHGKNIGRLGIGHMLKEKDLEDLVLVKERS
jgi:hypothetical protein